MHCYSIPFPPFSDGIFLLTLVYSFFLEFFHFVSACNPQRQITQKSCSMDNEYRVNAESSISLLYLAIVLCHGFPALFSHEHFCGTNAAKIGRCQVQCCYIVHYIFCSIMRVMVGYVLML